ncbi:MAG: hypothetical protein JO013_16610 [Alphaproteobacteria bacterium]|nr:hypothetical protein [Alphaproteobacteria bacterium]
MATKTVSGSVPVTAAFAEFLPELWEPYRSCFETDDQAIGSLWDGNPWWIEVTAKQLGVPDTDVRLVNARRARHIVEELRTRLSDGTLVATGVVPPSPQRVEIPKERWAKLGLTLTLQVAYDENFRFIEVEIGQGAVDQNAAVEAAAKWLASQPRTPRKILQHDARKHFPSITTRQFSEACRRAFGPRGPGRPPNPPKEEAE